MKKPPTKHNKGYENIGLTVLSESLVLSTNLVLDWKFSAIKALRFLAETSVRHEVVLIQ